MRAFSLVEILAVAAATGLLLGVGVSSMSEAMARERARQARLNVAQQLELVLKEGRNRFLPVVIDVDPGNHGICYHYADPSSPLNALRAAIAVNGFDCGVGMTGACPLQSPSLNCNVLTNGSIPGCVDMRATLNALLKDGDADGMLALRQYSLSITENISPCAATIPASDKGQIDEPLLMFTSRPNPIVITRAGTVLSADRRIQFTDAYGRTATVEVLDTGLVRFVP